MTPFTVACVQTNATRTIADNLAVVTRLVHEARDRGADLILTPENVAILEPKSDALRAQSEPWEGHSVVAAFGSLARDVKAWLLAGSIPVNAPSGKVFNRSVLFDDTGAVVAHYDKIHLFDVDLPSGERYRESASFEAGDRAVVAETPWGPIGLSVCYDVRFPHLYRQLAQAGARYLVVPSAFTKTTGEAHWHVLLRARAIEAGAFVFAPAQTGTHAEGRRTFGHSLIVDPWGTVLADGGDDVGVVTARIEPALVDAARGQVPAVNHQPAFLQPVGVPLM
jgi:predicted amidohydrolase